MSLLEQTWAWLTDPMNWSGYAGIPARLGEHAFYTILTVAIAAVIALPIGAYVGHTGRGRVVVVGLAGALRAVPTLGLLVLFVLLAGIGLMPPIWALVILSVPPLLAGTYSGIAAVDPVVVDAARAQGMREDQVLLGVELPNALPVIFGGLRAAVLQVIATATVVAYTNLGGLGRYIFDGLALSDYPQMLGGSVLVAALAVVTDLVLGALLRVLGPRSSSAAKPEAPAAAVQEGIS
ncbi:ABC transporter permease [Sinomonas cyclohexanicum]|uniref:ABC transporter permease n=1 Tax=Sinomonas cyclohexanicum TaxID=322009 RepID=A0ABN6FJ99_SINCY|nr:ABC transporter permease [Corynebacterium cyclohexanicum]BCT76957.1 ABC transporter permease [Corynebacterium cyclohexanicum]